MTSDDLEQVGEKISEKNDAEWAPYCRGLCISVQFEKTGSDVILRNIVGHSGMSEKFNVDWYPSSYVLV